MSAETNDRPAAAAIQTYARTAGVLMIISLIAGFFGEMYGPSKIIVPDDAGATARNISTMNSLFRWSFAAYLAEALCDVSLSLLFYVLLRAVQKELALLAAFFGLVSTAVYAVAELFYLAPAMILKNAAPLKAIPPDQLAAVVLLSLKLFAFGGGAFLIFYGVASLFRGWLIYRSAYLPRALGVLLMIGGAGFIAKTFTFVLAPSHSSSLLLLPMAVAGLPLMLWLVVKGVDVDRWAARAGVRPGPLP